MNTRKIFAIFLIAAGALGLAYGGFSYTKETHSADISSLHFSLTGKEHVYIPIWAGVAFVLVGGIMLTTQNRL